MCGIMRLKGIGEELVMQLDAIGDWIRLAREAKGWSQSKLARSARIACSTLNRWERGRTLPSVPELEAILRVLGVSEMERAHALSLLHARRAVRAVKQVDGQYTTPPLIGDVIRALRWRRGWSVSDLAHAVQVSERAVRAWERSENLPSDQMLHQLCFVLGASAEEAAVLTSRRVFLALPASGVEVAEERVREALLDLWNRLWRGDTEGMDLRFLTLESQAWHLAHTHKRGAYWWGAVQITRCQWLLHQSRIKEAEQRAYATWRLVSREPAHRRGSAWLIQAIARGSMRNHKGELTKPLEGAQVLHDWLELVRPWKEMEAWFLRGIAECLSIMQRHDEAIAHSLNALHLAQQTEYAVEAHLSQNSVAYMLLRANRAHEAVNYLSQHPNLHPVNQVEDALLWHETLSAVGERADALRWYERAVQLVQQHQIPGYHSRLASLEQTL
ncbi:MAG: hypothetical protein KatS3mg019_1382 [Fimbriimonadales bacterium]|nr:MAG: hypothetical protein KatS3mg019_1382 [Fimbriimonadales bacterium]